MYRTASAALLGGLLTAGLLTGPAQAAPAAPSASWIPVSEFGDGTSVTGRIRKTSRNSFEYDFHVTPGNSGLNKVYLNWQTKGSGWFEVGGGKKRTKAGSTRRVRFTGTVSGGASVASFNSVHFQTCYDVRLGRDVCGGNSAWYAFRR